MRVLYLYMYFDILLWFFCIKEQKKDLVSYLRGRFLRAKIRKFKCIFKYHVVLYKNKVFFYYCILIKEQQKPHWKLLREILFRSENKIEYIANLVGLMRKKKTNFSSYYKKIYQDLNEGRHYQWKKTYRTVFLFCGWISAIVFLFWINRVKTIYFLCFQCYFQRWMRAFVCRRIEFRL